MLIPRVSHDQSFASRLIVNAYDLDSYVGVPIFLPDGRLYGALCAIDSRPVLFEDPDVYETLEIFARLIGCIFCELGGESRERCSLFGMISRK